jgi:hypothetical protein
VSEHGEQAALFEWAALRANQYPEVRLLYAIPNGGYRAKATAVRLKAEGVREGVPDTHLPVARGAYHGLYIEMKVKGGRVRSSQSNWIYELRRQGYMVAVCWSKEQAIDVIEDYLGIPAGERTEHFT